MEPIHIPKFIAAAIRTLGSPWSLRLVIITLSLLLAFVSISPASAGTSVSGMVSSDETWAAVDSPFVITGNVLVATGATLIIEAGAVVKFSGAYSLQVNGTLVARGTASANITFTSSQSSPSAGDWDNIQFFDASIDADFGGATPASANYTSGSILEYVIVEYGGTDSDGAIALDTSAPLISNAIIRNNSGAGIYVDKAPSSFTVTNSTSTYNGKGIHFPYANGGNITLSGNAFTHNTGTGIQNNDRMALTIASNTISYNGGNGITTNHGAITNNTITYNSNSGIQVYQNAGQPITVQNNIIVGNTASDGAGIYIHTYCTNTISNNIISHNTATGYGGGIRHHGIGNSCFQTGLFSNNTVTGNKAGNGAGIYHTVKENNHNPHAITFENNTITQNSSSNSESASVWIESPYAILNNNNIFANDTTYELYDYQGIGAADLDIQNNWWGTNDQATIQTKIYD